MPPYDEQQDDRPEWEIEDEKIPPSLDKKWKEEERQAVILLPGGARKGSIFACQLQEKLSGPACGQLRRNLGRGQGLSLQKSLSS